MKRKIFDVYNNLIFNGEYKNGKKLNGQGYDGSKKIVFKLKMVMEQ